MVDEFPASNVVAQITPETVNSLRERRLLSETLDTTEQSLELDTAKPGEQILGVLSTEHAQIFCQCAQYRQEVMALQREIVADNLTSIADRILNNEKVELAEMSVDEERGTRMCELRAIEQYLYNWLLLDLGSLYGFNTKIGFRRGFKVVKTGLHYVANKAK